MEAEESILETAQRSYNSLAQAIQTLEVILKSVSTSSNGVFIYSTKNIGVEVREVTKAELERGLQFNSFSESDINAYVGAASDVQAFASLRLPSSLADRIFVQGSKNVIK